MQKKVKVALIGHGHLGRWHAQKADKLETSELVAIVEVNKQSHEGIKKEYPQAIITESLESILDHIDAAIIATPTSFHAANVEALLMAGKHVFCEKPVVANLDELNHIRGVRKKYPQPIFQVGHSERCHEVWAKLANYPQVMESPTFVRMNRMGPFKGRATDVDVVSDLMIHDIDLMVWLFGKKPTHVKAWGEKMRTEHWDFVHAEFSFSNSLKTSLTVARNHTHEVRELEVVSKEGTLRVDLLKGEYSFADPKENEPDNYVKNYSYQKRDHLFIEQESFYTAILELKEPMVNFEEGGYAVELVGGVLKALETGDEVSLV